MKMQPFSDAGGYNALQNVSDASALFAYVFLPWDAF